MNNIVVDSFNKVIEAYLKFNSEEYFSTEQIIIEEATNSRSVINIFSLENFTILIDTKYTIE